MVSEDTGLRGPHLVSEETDLRGAPIWYAKKQV